MRKQIFVRGAEGFTEPVNLSIPMRLASWIQPD